MYENFSFFQLRYHKRYTDYEKGTQFVIYLIIFICLIICFKEVKET